MRNGMAADAPWLGDVGLQLATNVTLHSTLPKQRAHSATGTMAPAKLRRRARLFMRGTRWHSRWVLVVGSGLRRKRKRKETLDEPKTPPRAHRHSRVVPVDTPEKCEDVKYRLMISVQRPGLSKSVRAFAAHIVRLPIAAC